VFSLVSSYHSWTCDDRGTGLNHFVYIHCGRPTQLDNRFVGHWGGIVFANEEQESDAASGNLCMLSYLSLSNTLPLLAVQAAAQFLQPQSSILRYVEFVGAGGAHNDTSPAISIINKHVSIIDNVNITNSSMHGLLLLAPRQQVNTQNNNYSFISLD
jgi:hypothetical protein